MKCVVVRKTASGIFFSESTNRVGFDQPATLIVAIEIEVYVYESASGLHIYLYANGNPATYIDPSGNFSMTEITIISGIVGTLAGLATYNVTGNIQEAIVVGLAAAIATYVALPYMALAFEASLVSSGVGLTATGSVYTFAGKWLTHQLAVFSYMVLRVSYMIAAEAGIVFCGSNYTMCRAVVDRVAHVAQNAQAAAEKVGDFVEAASEIYRIFDHEESEE